MAIPLYLAKTAAEFTSAKEQPPYLAWMACHFSPYGTGLTNLPSRLPENSLLILNDRTPVYGHDPKRIKETLEEVITGQACWGVLLDFQRPDFPDTAGIVKELRSLPCPVCVSDLYARELDCPVFLPPVPLTVPLAEHLLPWQGREIWLEVALDAVSYTVTEKGASSAPLLTPCAAGLPDGTLCCHYHINVQEDSIHFSIWRTREDLDTLINSADRLGVTHAVGLWQELHDK